MLTSFEYYSDSNMPNELKLEILHHIIRHDFPNSLISLSKTSWSNYHLAQNPSIWHAALQIYFPAQRYKGTTSNLIPIDHFKSLYLILAPVLEKHDLRFSDFVNAVVTKQSTLIGRQLDALQGLLLAAGHTLINDATISAPICEYALLYSAGLGNTHLVDKQFIERPFPFSEQIIREAFLLAASSGRQFITSSLIHHVFQFLDPATLRKALLNAAEKGHTRVVALLMQPPCVRIITFTLKTVCRIAMHSNYPDILSLLLIGNEHYRYAADLRLGALEAAEQNLTSIIIHAYQLASKQFDDVTIRKILKISAALGNRELITFFITHPAVARSPSIITETLRAAMDNDHEAISLLVLQAGRNQVKLYFKRDLFLEAARKGFDSIIRDLVCSDNIKVDQRFYMNAYTTAQIFQQLATSELLMQYIQNSEHDNKEITSLAETIDQLSLNENSSDITTLEVRSFTPSFQRKDTPTLELTKDNAKKLELHL